MNEQMNEYVWDRSDPVDPDIAHLERTLEVLKYAPAHAQARPAVLFRGAGRRMPARAAAILAITIGGAWLASLTFTSLRSPSPNGLSSAWEVTALQGLPRVGSSTISGSEQLRIGQWLQTDGQSHARLALAGIGTVTVEPDSRVRLMKSAETEHRIELARGGIEAFITAPPRLFFVETPAATAVDLGCKYRLEVEPDGSGTLAVSLGWVSFERGGVESIVPHGGVCKTRAGIGPGTPYFDDAPPRLIAQLERFDFDDGGDDAIDAVLAEARPRDSLTLWHLARRLKGEARGKVLDRLASLAPPPGTLDRSAALAGNPTALNVWRDALPWSPLPFTRADSD
jgi:hypothetical protein